MMITRLLFLIFILLSSPFHGAGAAIPALPKADLASELESQGIARVVQVIDSLTVSLEDGRIVRLAGIDYTDLMRADGALEPGPYSVMGVKVLKDLLEGKTVEIYQTRNEKRGRVNRMGHIMAHLQTEKDKAWVQGTLVALGLARVMTSQENPEMALPLYTLERAARADKLGLWQQPQILSPEAAAEHLYSFQIVEGTIKGAAMKQNRLYLNFGDNWKTDFTVSIAPEDRKKFQKQGLDPQQWANETVRVRGWIQSYNGPYIEIDHPERFELPPSLSPQEKALKTTAAKKNEIREEALEEPQNRTNR